MQFSLDEATQTYSWTEDDDLPGSEASLMLMRIIAQDPHRGYSIVLSMLDATESEEEIGLLGSGPLEELLRNHAGELIRELEKDFQSHIKLRIALANVWISESVPEEIRNRIQKLGARDISSDK